MSLEAAARYIEETFTSFGKRLDKLEESVTKLLERKALTLDNSARGVSFVKWNGSGLESVPTVVEHGLGNVPKIVIATANGGNFSAVAFTDSPSAWTKEKFEVYLLAAKAIPKGGTQQNFSWVAIV